MQSVEGMGFTEILRKSFCCRTDATADSFATAGGGGVRSVGALWETGGVECLACGTRKKMAGRDVRSATSPDLPLRLWPCHDLAEHRIRTVSSSCRGPDVIAAASAVQIRHLDIASDDSEEDKTLLQHHTNTVVSVPVVRSVVVAVRTTNVVRFVVPGAAPQNAERPRATDPSPSAQTHGCVIAEPALCSDRFTNASLSESTNPRIFKLARRAAPVAEIANRRNRIRVTEDRGPEARATETSASESQRKNSEEDKTLLQHHTNTDVSEPVDRSAVVAARTTNVVRSDVPGAAPQNAERPRVGPRGIGSG
jgi:hypothetical protein